MTARAIPNRPVYEPSGLLAKAGVLWDKVDLRITGNYKLFPGSADSPATLFVVAAEKTPLSAFSRLGKAFLADYVVAIRLSPKIGAKPEITLFDVAAHAEGRPVMSLRQVAMGGKEVAGNGVQYDDYRDAIRLLSSHAAINGKPVMTRISFFEHIRDAAPLLSAELQGYISEEIKSALKRGIKNSIRQWIVGDGDHQKQGVLFKSTTRREALLNSQRGAILVPTTGEVQRPIRSLWNRLWGRKETLTNAPTNGPPTVRANGDNIDIPLADSVVRREPTAPTLNAMVGNDMGFENGRPVIPSKVEVRRAPPNQFLKDEPPPPTVPQAQNLTSESGPTNLTNRTYKVGDKLPDGRVAGDGPGTPSATQIGRPDSLLLEYKNKGQKALTYNPEPVYTRKYTESLRSFQEEVKPVVEKYGMTVDEFYRFMPERAETLTVKQRARMIAIRESVPKPTPETLFEKVVSHGDIQKYLGGKYTTVQGFVNRAQDIKGVKNPFEIYQSLRLDYEGTPIDPYSNRPVGVIRFKIAETKKVEIPFSKAMGGNAVEAYPFTGNGFTAAENGRIIPEFKLPRDQFGNGFQPTSAELFEVSRSGIETLRAVYDARLKRFIPVGNE